MTTYAPQLERLPTRVRPAPARPRRRRISLPYAPGLDGLRGLAVIAVVLYHAGVSWATGGFLGVELFFVLSGFLITSLLLEEWRQSATVKLMEFWSRRARRLLPALLVMVSVIGVYYALAGPEHAIPGLRNDGLSTLLYAGNWHQISTDSSYFAASGQVSPLQHTWSLAIEEQFYVFWPLLLLGALWLAGRRTRTEGARARSLRMLLVLSLLGVLASAIDTGILFDGGKGLDRVYYGTDTRAASLLIGASAAIWRTLRGWRPGRSWAGTPGPRRSGWWRALTAAVPVLALAGLGAAMSRTSGQARWLYPYGLLAVDLAAVTVVLTAVSRPWAPISRALSWGPLRGLGKISYGIYLWHFPLFQWLDQSSTGLSGTPLVLLRLAVALGVSVVSWVLIEQPIRRRRLPRWIVGSLAPIAAGAAVASLLLASALSSAPLSPGPVPFSQTAARAVPKLTARLPGTQAACQQRLTDTTSVGLAPLPEATAARTEYTALGQHALSWRGARTVTFHTCPPEKVLVVGDSVAYTLGVGLMEHEQRYGIEVGNAAMLGCAFTPAGELQVGGSWEARAPGCSRALRSWAGDAQVLGARAVIVELGYRDEFDWLIGGRVQHLGQAAYDGSLQQQLDDYVKLLGAGGRRVLFLSVPWTNPPANPDGSAAAAASPARHAAINAILARAARGHANVSVLDLDQVVSPHNRYQGTVNGRLCRLDGVHFTLYCSELLQPYVLGAVRTMLGG